MKHILKLLEEYPELTTPLSRHLISQYERKGIVEAKQRLSLIRYQSMTKEIFDQFLSLFKQTGSDVNQRKTKLSTFSSMCCFIQMNKLLKMFFNGFKKDLLMNNLLLLNNF